MIILPLLAAAAIIASPPPAELKLVCKGSFRLREVSETFNANGDPVPVVTTQRRSGQVLIDLHGSAGAVAFDNGGPFALKDAVVSATAINASYAFGPVEPEIAIDRVGGTVAITERGATVFFGRCKGQNPPSAKGAPQF